MAKISETASVETSEALEAKLKRSIVMKMFFTDKQKAEINLAKANGDPPEKCEVVGGTIIGRIFEVKEKQGELPNGEISVSLVAIGEFECVRHDTGEVWEAPAAYLPGYYLESAKAALEKSGDNEAIQMAAEVLCVATGKAVPFAYELRNVLPREVNSPMNQLKARLAKAGKLHKGLPPPVKHEPIDRLEAPTEPAKEGAAA